MSFGDEMAPPPARLPWIVSGTRAQLEAWRAAAERAGFNDAMHWVQRVLDAASVHRERRFVVPASHARHAEFDKSQLDMSISD